jgi:hypothetical protein
LELFSELKDRAKPLLKDYILGFMEIFRSEMAIGHPNLIDKSTFKQQVVDFIEQKAPEKRIFEAIEDTNVGIYTNADKDKFKYTLTNKGKSYGIILDTNKTHSDGSPIQQIKWKESILPIIEKTFNYKGW